MSAGIKYQVPKMVGLPRRELRYYFIIAHLFFLTSFHHAPAQSLQESQLPEEIQSALAREVQDTARINIFLDAANQAQQKDPVQALTYCFYALRLARKVSSEHYVDQALLRIGKFLFHQGLFEEAMEYYKEYQARALASGNLLNQLKVRHNIIALKLVVNEKYDQALYSEMKDLLNNYQALWKQEGNKVVVQEMIPGLLINLAHVAIKKGALNEADEFLKVALELSTQHQIPEQTINQIFLTNFVIKSKMAKYEEAFDLAGNLRKTFLQYGNLVELTTLDYYTGMALENKGDLKEAAQSYESAFSLAEKLGNNSLISEIATKLSEIYQESGQFETALQYNDAAQKAKEAMKKVDAASQIAQSEMQERIYALENEVVLEKRSRTTRFIIAGTLSLASIIGLLVLFLRVRKKYQLAKKEKKGLAVKASKSELEKESLSTALETKDKQLATEIMYRVQRNEIIREAVQKLIDAQRQHKKDAQKEMAEAIKDLERAMDGHSWEDFELRFLQVHHGFYERLQELQPKLTTNERRLCAFLKLGMNSKEISTLTGQSTQSIVMARHRLRKKLNLPDPETSLVEFLANI